MQLERQQGKVYRGKRMRDGVVVIVDDNGLCYQLPFRRDLANHSPDGFNWGYGGSGPAQLALGLCADALRNDYAAKLLYQEFKWMWVAGQHGTDWELSHVELVEKLERCMEVKRLTLFDLQPAVSPWDE